MTARGGVLCIAFLASFFFSPVPMRAQASSICTVGPPQESAPGKISLKPWQEAELGKIAATAFEWHRPSFSDPRITDYPEAILRRLLKNVPAAGLHPQVRFYNAAFPDAFVLPGGRIYISRQIVTFLHSESDLAALLAHEMGHELAHQSAIEFGQAFRRELRITDLTTGESVFGAYSALADWALENPKAADRWAAVQARSVEPGQEAADRTAVYLLASAGYPPQAMETLYNRLARTHGKTGDWLTDMFGFTTPQEKRLRALQKRIDQLPASCRGKGSGSTIGDFSAWRSALIAFEPSLAARRRDAPAASGNLTPGVPGALERIRFSPNGQYILAHDPSGILVYATRPLHLLFRVAAPGATSASFSPDSSSVEMHTRGLRVEKWDIATRKMISLNMAVPLSRCWMEADSPDGKLLVAMGCGGDLSIVDERTGRVVFTKRVHGVWGEHSFSPDGRYFLTTIWNFTSVGALAVDLKERREVPVSQALRYLLGMCHSFVFLSSDRLAMEKVSPGRRDFVLVQFPTGKLLGSMGLSRPKPPEPRQGQRAGGGLNSSENSLPSRVGRVAGGRDEVLAFPFGTKPAALLDVARRKVVAALSSPVVDVYGDDYAIQHERWLRMDDLKTGRIVASVELPTGLLGHLTAVEVSPDLKWLAISDPAEGAVYSLANGRLIDETPAFSGAWFGPADALYADFHGGVEGSPSRNSRDSVVRRVDLETSAAPFRLEHGPEESQYGPYVLAFRKSDGSSKAVEGVRLEVRGLSSGQVFWTRTIPDRPSTIGLGPAQKTLLLGWPVLPAIRVGLLLNTVFLAPEGVRRYLGIAKNEDGYAFQIFDGKTGKMLGHFLLAGEAETLDFVGAVATGSELAVSDKFGRTQVFSWKTGQREGLTLGRLMSVSRTGALACVAQTLRLIKIYPFPSLVRPLATFRFAHAIEMARFSRSGRRIFILTRDQHYYIFTVPTDEAQPGGSQRNKAPTQMALAQWRGGEASSPRARREE